MSSGYLKVRIDTLVLSLMKYEQNQTILIWSDQAEVVETLEHVVATSFKKAKIFIAERREDLVAVPCFLIIMEGKYLDIATLDMLEEMLNLEDSTQPRIVIRGLCVQEIPESLKKRVLIGVDLYKYLPVRKLIRKEYDQANSLGGRKDAFIGMISRIIQTILNEEGDLNEVSKSSLYRDQKIIEKASVLSGSPSPCKRPERIVAIFLYMNRNTYLSRSFACESFGITERTLNRDLAILGEVLTVDPYYDDSNGCYRL